MAELDTTTRIGFSPLNFLTIATTSVVGTVVGIVILRGVAALNVPVISPASKAIVGIIDGTIGVASGTSTAA